MGKRVFRLNSVVLADLKRFGDFWQSPLDLVGDSGFLFDSDKGSFFSMDFVLIRPGTFLDCGISFCDVTVLPELAIELPLNLLLSFAREPRPPLLESVDD